MLGRCGQMGALGCARLGIKQRRLLFMAGASRQCALLVGAWVREKTGEIFISLYHELLHRHASFGDPLGSSTGPQWIESRAAP